MDGGGPGGSGGSRGGRVIDAVPGQLQLPPI